MSSFFFTFAIRFCVYVCVALRTLFWCKLFSVSEHLPPHQVSAIFLPTIYFFWLRGRSQQKIISNHEKSKKKIFNNGENGFVFVRERERKKKRKMGVQWNTHTFIELNLIYNAGICYAIAWNECVCVCAICTANVVLVSLFLYIFYVFFPFYSSFGGWNLSSAFLV